MPRAPRSFVAGGVYHVTSRGNRRQPVFLRDEDRAHFLFLLGRVARQRRWRCHAYCLMPNHFHLIVELTSPDLSAGMQRLNGSYAQWFNERHALSGHLFQGRFHAGAIESIPHLLHALRYVVLNPVRARLCARAIDWPWSSFRAAVGASPSPPFLPAEWLLSQFADDRNEARELFRRFVDDLGHGL